jgi:hypothetical protein
MPSAIARFLGLSATLAVVALAQSGVAQESGQRGQFLTPIGGQVETVAALMAQADGFSSGGGGWQGAHDVATPSSFAALTLADTAAIPPDASLGVGPTQVLVIANGRMRSFNKVTGMADGVLDLNPSTFFGSVRAGGGVFGGRVKFDRWTGRWFVSMATDATPGRIVLASSNSATLTAATTWRFSAFDNTFTTPTSPACGVDMPTLAIDSLALYLGVNQFCGGVYAGTSGFVVRKSSALDAATFVVTAFHNLTSTATGSGPFAPRGVDNVDAPATVGYFVGVDNAAFGQLVIRRVVNPGGTPTLADPATLAVPQTQLPILVPHAGNTAGANGQLNPGDDRLASAVMRNGRLWLVHTVGTPVTGSPTTNGTRWYEVATPDSIPTLSQSGTLEGAGGSTARHYWNGSLAVTGEGRTVVGFNVAGTTELISAGLADRRSATPAGTLSSATLVAASPAAYNPTLDPGSATGRRWGRYSETVADGCDDMTVWSVQSVAEPANAWTLRVARVVSTPPPAAAAVSPASVRGGQTSVAVDITATSGQFFDPAAGFGCRIAVTIPGVTVTAVTRVDATTLRATLSTVNAIAGVKAITVTHPDGQTSSSAGLLTVTPAVAMGLDTPLLTGQPLRVTGWALDGRASTGTGVDSVAVYAYPATGAPVLLGQAVLGESRTDVAGTYGPQFLAAGFSLRTTTVLPVGTYTVVAFAHSAISGEFASRDAGVTVVAPTPPFGVVDTPADDATVAGEVGFTGWAIGAGGVRDVRVYRDAVGAEPAGLVYVGMADFVRGARPDVQAAYPGYADNDRAGWGFMVLTNMLPNQGNGRFVFSAVATNHVGQSTIIGTRRITAANTASQLPFGTIDTPGQGAEVSGTVVNFGWVLTPSPLGIPTDGSTISVYIDGVMVGHPVYNQFRSDIAALFPGYANSNGAVGYFMIDTTRLADGLHSIVWGVRDSAGQVNGIGSRNFRVRNGS